MVKTSIIIPVYNAAPYLRECLDSVFAQTQKEIEVIAINDGSTDNSLSVLEAIKVEHPELIIFSQENQRQGAARNKGMELATGEFIYFMDSDDCLASDAMETCYHYAKMNDVDIVMFDADIFGEIEGMVNTYDRKEIIEEQYVVMNGEGYAQKYWLRKFCPSPCLIYTSAKFLKTYNYRFMPRMYYEDNVFHCRVIPSANLIYLPQMLYKRRYRENSTMTSAFDLCHAKDYLKMIQLIDEQKHSEGIRDAINKLQLLWVGFLLQQCVENNLWDDPKFAEDFYWTAQTVYGCDVDQIDQYKDIVFYDQLSNALGHEIRKKIQNKCKELLEIFGEKSHLAKEGDCVGIYGTGVKTEKLLGEYREAIGGIKANLVFIDSNVKSGEKKYKNFDVFRIDDIGDISLACIIITSEKYERQMKNAIQRQYGDKFKVLVWKPSFQLEE